MLHEALRAERDLTATYLDVAQVLIVVVKTDCTIQYANRKAAESLGWSPEEMIGRDWFELAVPERLRTERRRDFDAILSGASVPESSEVVVVSRTGEERLVEWRMATLTDKDGAVIATLGSGLDVTKQRHAEQEVERQAARFRILAEASHAFAEVALDYDALLRVIAKRAAEIIGDGAIVNLLSEDGAWIHPVAVYSPDPELTRAYHAMLVATPARAGEGVAGRVIAENVPVLIPEVAPEAIAAATRPEWRDVSRRLNVHSLLLVPMRVRGVPVGSVTLYRNRPGWGYGEADQSLLQDLADRAALAVENARLHTNVERRVAERTADLETAMSELEAFSYSVSHDLRAPLRGIDGFSAALLEDCADQLSPEGKEHLHRVRESAQRMATLIDDLLNLSKVTRAPLQRESVDLSALARSVLARLADLHPRGGVETIVEEGLVARADPRLLDIVLTNLLANAWKFTGNSHPARIELASSAGSPRVYFVRDNGAGFEQAHAGRLFGVFQRLHTTNEFEGTGIGLATVERIVRRHGGRVWAEGEVGRGATLYFTLEDGA